MKRKKKYTKKKGEKLYFDLSQESGSKYNSNIALFKGFVFRFYD